MGNYADTATPTTDTVNITDLILSYNNNKGNIMLETTVLLSVSEIRSICDGEYREERYEYEDLFLDSVED